MIRAVGGTLRSTVGAWKCPRPPIAPPQAISAPCASASATSGAMAALRRALTMGPICTAGFMPLPSFKAWASVTKRSQNSRSIDLCTRKRVGARQACPALRNLCPTSMGTNRSRSASAHTMTGACPPSSIVVRLNPSAHCRASVRPTPTEPVKDTLRMTGLAIKVSDISTGFPYTS